MSVSFEKVEQCLPQTQCRQCGYGGCQPYARALTEKKETNPSLCRPGGQQVADKLADLLKLEKSFALPWNNDLVAHVETQACIGCQLCQVSCPSEAFMGAAGLLHQVKEQYCHGCQLCLSHCPTQCITMKPRTPSIKKPTAQMNLKRFLQKKDREKKAQKDKLFAHKRATAELRKPQEMIAHCLKKAQEKKI